MPANFSAPPGCFIIVVMSAIFLRSSASLSGMSSGAARVYSGSSLLSWSWVSTGAQSLDSLLALSTISYSRRPSFTTSLTCSCIPRRVLPRPLKSKPFTAV